MGERTDTVVSVTHIEHPENIGIGLIDLWRTLGKGSLPPAHGPLESIAFKSTFNLLGQRFNQGRISIREGPGLAINCDLPRLGHT